MNPYWKELADELDQAALHLYRAGRKLDRLNQPHEAQRIHNLTNDVRNWRQQAVARGNDVDMATPK